MVVVAGGMLLSIFSTPATVIEAFLADSPEYVDLPTFGARTVNAITGSLMLALAGKFQEELEEGAAARNTPNTAVLGEALESLLRLKAIWGRRLLAVTLLMVKHPTLGDIALCQPLLVAAATHRVFNYGETVDPVFEVLLRVSGERGEGVLRDWMRLARQGGLGYTAYEAFVLMRAPLEAGLKGADPGAIALVDAFAELLRPPAPAAAAPPPTRAPRAPDQGWPWSQAMANVTWAVSQVAMARGASRRRAVLRRLQAEAPFTLPAMSVVSVAQLRELGRIPRFSLPGSAQDLQGGGPDFRPLPVDGLPSDEDSIVVFVSHRWLGNGCPDDEHGTKLKQVYAIAQYVADFRRVPLDKVYLWLDYSVVDQSNPMPGVQALPIYIACCDEFVYVKHEQYWQRAWCLTEQFMDWKLAGGDVKHVLDPDTLTASVESRVRPPDPSFGKLAVESDRIALATITSIMPYDMD
ncbi:hypothetical protein TSOC_004736 [Tetrabaena socialis]|uniref:Uncharacterized protein n=1 Tax=Tetrabaena socialis TaxID=47790 RepID=A0A2J8A851_9CHLO|nr:hypothetical protein TSOC_004736 [Tetrabaena socialis]|eukprot:PNH08707.1 hypothetical protein TSOC_004736 [Tetrabaena socialis]